MFDFVKYNYLSTSSYFGIQNCIDGVMVSVLSSSALDRGSQT